MSVMTENEELLRGLGAPCPADLDRVIVGVDIAKPGQERTVKSTLRPAVPDSEWEHAVRYVERLG